MRQLGDYLLAKDKRAGVVADCAAVIEGHIANRSGLKGVGMRTGLSLVKAAKHEIVPRAVDWLLPDFALALDPQFQEAQRAKKTFTDTVLANQQLAVSALLRVADQRADEVKSPVVKSFYQRMRSSAEDEVAQALPSLVRALARHIPE